MSHKQVVLPDIGLVDLYKRRSNRSLRLSISANGTVRVSLPYWVPYRAAEDFAKRRTGWILEQQANRVPQLEHGQLIGKAHRLCFAVGQSPRVSSRITPTEIRIRHPIVTTPDHPTIQQKARAASVKALRQEAELLLPRRLQRLAQAYGFEYKNIQVKRLKSRWGSCSSQQEITLNLFLMQLPWRLIDYVLVHELVHTKVMQHGQPFWREFEQHLPHAKALREEINTHQPVLAPH